MGKWPISLFIGLLILFSSDCFSQTNVDPLVWKNIEASICQQKQLETSLNRLAVIKGEAQKNDNAIELARSLCYMMLIKDIRTEDSLYFHNSFFIDSILQTSSNQELNLLMHYLQAQRLWKFRTKYLKFNRARYETKSVGINYAALSNEQLDSAINYHFEQAKELTKRIVERNKRQWDVEQISWLSSSPLTFLFKPTLFDIISFEQITAISKIESSNAPLSLFYEQWLPLSQDQMIDSVNALAKRSETKGSILLFLRWLDIHKSDPAIYYFIETLFREQIYKSLYPTYNQNYQKQYETYLASIISSPYPEVKARAIYQLCVLWKEWSLKYAGENYRYANFGQSFDTLYRQYAVKAINLYDENRQLFKNYGFLQQQLEQLRTEILFPKLQILLGNEYEKNKPLLLKIQYKNLPVFYYRIVRLKFDEELSTATTNKEFLLSHEKVEEEKIDLPLPLDYNPHRVLVKLSALSSGNYCLIFSKEPIDSAKTYSYQSFVVSDLAFLHSDDRVYVLNRVTGKPVKGGLISALSGNKNVADGKFRTNEKGFFTLPLEGEIILTATYNGDTLRGKVSSGKRELPDEVFSKEEYEDLVDYYDENSSIMIFTDRGIYRPGQKVFFKAIAVTKNPRTGEMMIMNKQHLKKGFRNYLKKWFKEMEPLLYLEDPFGRDFDSVKLKPDQYGSVSGYFTIPKNAATGDWSIVPDYLDAYRVNKGEFKVEEYKKPTFELTVDKPSKNYKIGDTLSFRIKLKSFSGSILNRSLVKYQIERRDAYGEIEYDKFADIDSSGFTNEQGVLQIKFFDTSLHQIDYNENINLDYNLTATVTDVAGETHEGTAILKVSTKPVIIRIPALTTIDLADLKPIAISAKDKNDVPVLKSLQVKLYRLSNLSNKSDNEFSSDVDQWMYSAEQLEQWFPENRFSQEPSIPKEELVFETTINTADFEKLRWPEGTLVPGSYKISVSSLDDGFIDGESSKTFTVFDSRTAELPNGESSFFYLQANYLQVGDTVRLFSGSKYDTTYLIRQVKYYSQKNKKQVVVNYYHDKKSKGIHKWEWKVPSDVSDNVTLSEVYVVNNRLYRREEIITINRIKKSSLKLLLNGFEVNYILEIVRCFQFRSKLKMKILQRSL